MFMLSSLLSVMEALFFTTSPATEYLSGLLTAVVGQAGLALLLTLVFVLTVFPLIAVPRRPRLSLPFWLAMTITVLGAVTPLLQASWLPMPTRVVHGVEITADSLGHAGFIAFLLGTTASEGAEIR